MPKGSSGTIFQYIIEQAAKALNESFSSPFPSLAQVNTIYFDRNNE